MKEINKEEALNVMLLLMDDIDAICNKYGLSYYLAYGTLIGAVRHHGIIPWDDDIDIQMPRRDYEKFIQIYSVEGKYSITSPHSKSPLYYYAKIYDPCTMKIEEGVSYENMSPLGIDIDIFPLDNYFGVPTSNRMPNKKCFQVLYYIRHYAIDVISTKKSKRFPLGAFCLGLFAHLIGNKNIMKIFVRLAKGYNQNDSQYLTVYSGMPKLSVFRKEDFESFELADFENRKYRIPIGYDNILRASYGDYMKLPPIEQQVTHHLNKVYWIEK